MTSPKEPQSQQAIPVLQALQAALAAEHAAVYGYGIVGAMLTGTERARAFTDWNLHQEARDTLEAMIVKLGATPVAASVAYQLPFDVADARSARRLAATLEDGVTQAYLGLVAVTDLTLRTFGALAMQPPADRAASWRGSTVAFPGMPPTPVAKALHRRPHPAGPARGGPTPPWTLLPVDLLFPGSIGVRQGKHPGNGARRTVKVVGDGDPLRP